MSQGPFSSPEQNPYQAPVTPQQPYFDSGREDGVVTPQTIDLLRQTRPWVRFISVLMYVGGVFALIAGLFMMASLLPRGRAEGVVGIVYLIGGVLYFVPATFLGRYASHISNLEMSRAAGHLENALESQKSFWKFAGIMAAIVLAIYGLIFFFAIVVGFGALRLR